MTSFDVDIDVVMSLAKNSYLAAEQYAAITARITDTDAAAAHMADKDGTATAADSDVLAMIDEFREFLKTTTARYQLVGEQLEATAGAYVQTDTDEKAAYDRWVADLDQYGVGDADLGLSPDKESGDTDRPDAATDNQADGFGTDQDPADNVGPGSAYLEGIESSAKEGEN